MINSLRRKFIMVNMICVTLILVAVFSAILLTNISQLKKESQATLETALAFSDKGLPIQFNVDISDSYSGAEASNFVIHVSPDGKATPISAENVTVEKKYMNEILQQVFDRYNEKGKTEDTLKGKNYKLRYLLQEDPEGYDVAFVDISGELMRSRHMLYICLIAGVTALAGFFLVSFFLSRWALRPVEKAWNDQKRFAADASHELKTPLTVILANMEILKTNRDDKIGERMEWVNNTETEARRMKDLANNLLFLAKNGDMKKPQIVEEVNFSDAVMKTGLAFEPVAFEHKIGIDTVIETDVFVGGDENQIRQLVTILLDNAVKYSDDLTTIKISLKTVSGRAVLDVNNRGVIIAEEDLESIFRRFYRSDQSRSEEGYGLGLSIAKNIVDKYRGSISAKSNEEDGTTFTVNLPVYKA